MSISTYAVIPTHDRQDMFWNAIESVIDQVDHVIIIDNNSPGNHLVLSSPSRCSVIRMIGERPNIQRFWNAGIIMAGLLAQKTLHNVFIINDDVECPEGIVDRLSSYMRESGAALAYPDQFDICPESQPGIMNLKAEPVDMRTRIVGYAYMLRGEAGLMLDENFVWWYGDDDLDWRAREHGGSLLVPGCKVEHHAPNAQTSISPELMAQTARDRHTFIEKWGRAPH